MRVAAADGLHHTVRIRCVKPTSTYDAESILPRQSLVLAVFEQVGASFDNPACGAVRPEMSTHCTVEHSSSDSDGLSSLFVSSHHI